MPHVIVKMWPGPSEQAKQHLAEAIEPDIAGKRRTLYKQPGYTPT